MPPWFLHFVSAQEKESKSASNRFIQFATLGIDNTPRVRTVVFRGWTELYEMKILTDKRSQKFYELEINNNVEICWFFSKAKSQFRFRGKSIIDCSNDVSFHWNKLNEKAKSMWSWPSPRERFVEDIYNNINVSDNKNKSENFVLLKINILHVDQLLLHKPIHIRRQWKKSNNWLEERINP